MCTATAGRALLVARGGVAKETAREAAMMDLKITAPVTAAAVPAIEYAGQVRNERVKKEAEARRIKQASLTPSQVDAALKKRAQEVKSLEKLTPAERNRAEIEALLAEDERYLQAQKAPEGDLQPGTPEFEAEKQRRLAHWRAVIAGRAELEALSRKGRRPD